MLPTAYQQKFCRHISQLVFCVLLSWTAWVKGTMLWPIIVSYSAAHPIINAMCRLLT